MELNHLDLRHEALRIVDRGRVTRLAASIGRDGQRSPVLVAAGGVLVDGFHRVEALKQLGRDEVAAVELTVGEAEALILAWRLETGRRKTAIEEGWLLAELAEHHARPVSALAAEFRRPRSWVSERLGLVRALPTTVQAAVREQKLPAQAAMKCLVPMARVDADACAAMVGALTEPVSKRQVEVLYGAWRKADAQGRRRIVEAPMLLLRVEEQDAGQPAADAEEQLAQSLEGVAGLCRKARKAVREGAFPRGNTSFPRGNPARHAWGQAQEAFDALREEVDRGDA